MNLMEQQAERAASARFDDRPRSILRGFVLSEFHDLTSNGRLLRHWYGCSVEALGDPTGSTFGRDVGRREWQRTAPAGFKLQRQRLAVCLAGNEVLDRRPGRQSHDAARGDASRSQPRSKVRTAGISIDEIGHSRRDEVEVAEFLLTRVATPIRRSAGTRTAPG